MVVQGVWVVSLLSIEARPQRGKQRLAGSWGISSGAILTETANVAEEAWGWMAEVEGACSP